jgi:ribonuclease HI
VEELLLPDGQGWNEAKLNELFYESDVEDIMKISVGRAGTEDYIAWNQTKNGIFSVKSAYHLNMQLKERRECRAGSSSSCEEHRGWLSLWGADVPGKAWIHVWRMIKNGLAVGAELERRKIKPGVKCIACNRDETLLHRFWVCPHSVAIWEKVRAASGLQLPGPRLTTHRPSVLKGWLLDWLGRLSDKDLSIGIMVLYQMWLARNDARDEEKIEDPEDIARKSLALVEEWSAIKAGTRQVVQRGREHWLPPEEGWYKINADGAFMSSAGNGGCGAVIRDHMGAFVASECHFLPSVSDPERAELLACKRALILAGRKGLRRICLETDCLSAVAKIKGSDLDRSFHGPLVEEIKELLKMFAGHEVRHARRDVNGVAHKLASVGCGNKLCNIWLVSPPEFIVSLLASEYAG